mmetsp:Transcript_37568/g.101673  ORF Transcript_37568/g.101673 Transcript_37568/m.101673 type:complete len:102 (-) Transcript_37568:9-314(-)
MPVGNGRQAAEVGPADGACWISGGMLHGSLEAADVLGGGSQESPHCGARMLPGRFTEAWDLGPGRAGRDAGRRLDLCAECGGWRGGGDVVDGTSTASDRKS